MGVYSSPRAARQAERRSRFIRKSGVPYTETSAGAMVDDKRDKRGRSRLSLTAELDTPEGKASRRYIRARKKHAERMKRQRERPAEYWR